MTKVIEQPKPIGEVLMKDAEETASASTAPAAIKFKDCTVSFAVDTSGSTLGPILRHEQQAILDVYTKLSGSAQMTARVLPWQSEVGEPVPVTQLNSLDSYGGTDPTCLLNNKSTRQILKSSTVWFLFTDGEIDEYCVRHFARGLAEHGLHGTACVTTVFAPAYGKPDASNISVGVSVFAAAPDCLFLFFDTITRKLYVLQCSGRFTQILEIHKKSQPILDENTKWSDLPQIEFSDLEHISIPPPRSLSKDELALPDGLVLNLKDLWAGKVKDETIIDRLLLNDDNLKSLTLTAQTRGEVKAFHKWLEPFLDDSTSPLRDLPGDEGQAMRSIRAIIEEMQSGVSDEKLKQLQQDLQNARKQEEYAHYSATSGQSLSPRVSRASASVSAMHRSSETTYSSRSLSSIAIPELPRAPPKYQSYIGSTTFTSSVPGFQASDGTSTIFKGSCTICGTDNTNLVLLLRKRSLPQDTPGFPSPDAKQWLFCPFALGNFPETDIVSSSVCCDDCSYSLSQTGITPHGEELDCVLPLVTYAANEKAYLQQLNSALQNRFAEDILPQLWLAILVNTYQRLPDTSNNDLLRKAIKWSCKDLISNVKCHDNLTTALQNQPGRTASSPMRVVINEFFSQSYSQNGQVFFDYPLPGFVAMILALEHARSLPQLSRGTNNLVWHRFLYQVTHCYHTFFVDKGHALAQLKLMEMVREPIKTPTEKEVRKLSTRGLRDLGRSWLGESKSSENRVSVTPGKLAANDLLSPADLVTFEMLGGTFRWIEDNAGFALCVFLHFLARQDKSNQTAWQWFQSMRSDKRLTYVFEKPSQIKSKHVAEAIAGLPALAVDT